MKRFKVLFLFLGLFPLFSGCSQPNNENFHGSTLEFQEYDLALSEWELMNEYCNEGKCVSFNLNLEEFTESEKRFFIRGIDITSNYKNSQNNDLVILGHRGLSLLLSNDFYVLFKFKNLSLNTQVDCFEWKLYATMKDNYYFYINPEIPQKELSWYNSGDFQISPLCDTAYCLINSQNDIALEVGFTKEKEPLFFKYKDLFLQLFLENAHV